MRREEARTAGVAARLSLAQAPPPVADYVYLFPHAIDRALGPIELVPRSHPWGTHDIAAHEPALCARPAGGLDCRGLGEVRGPSPRLQHPSPDHPGHSPLPLLTRSTSPSTAPGRRARRGTPPPGCRFTRRRSRRARCGLRAHKSASPPRPAPPRRGPPRRGPPTLRQQVLIHEASLMHRGLANTALGATRYAVRRAVLPAWRSPACCPPRARPPHVAPCPRRLPSPRPGRRASRPALASRPRCAGAVRPLRPR